MVTRKPLKKISVHNGRGRSFIIFKKNIFYSIDLPSNSDLNILNFAFFFKNFC